MYILCKLFISMFFESHISLTGLYQAPILAAKKLAIFHTSLVCFLTSAVLSLLKLSSRGHCLVMLEFCYL